MITANQIWQRLQNGKVYNDKIRLNATVNRNEKFAAGEQWGNIESGDIKLVTDNIFTRIIAHFTSAIVAKGIKIQFTPELLSYTETVPVVMGGITTPIEVPIADILNAQAEHLWEKMKKDITLRIGVRKAIISGDIGGFYRWNKNIPTGQEAKGDIDFDLLDNVDVFFGNPNDRRVNQRGLPIQPYIIIASRESVKNLRAEAIQYGVSKKDALNILPDTNTEYKSGERGQVEMDSAVMENEKANVAYYFYPNDDGYIHCIKSIQNMIIRPDWNIKSKIYPINWGNWEIRDNSYHGQALITEQIPNQIAINQMWTNLVYTSLKSTLGKTVYDRTRIPEWNDDLGENIGVDGTDGAISDLIYNPPQQPMNSAYIEIPRGFTGEVKDSLGATDALMGDVKAENTSAIIAVRQASSVPLENPKAYIFQFVEDGAYIELDMMANHYGIRKIPVYINGKKEVVEFDFGKLKDMMFTVKVDVGEASVWSEPAATDSLTQLFIANAIDSAQLFEHMPQGSIPGLQKLIEEKRREKEEAKAMEQAAAQAAVQAPMPPIQA